MTIAELLKNFLHDYTIWKNNSLTVMDAYSDEFVETRHTLIRIENCIQDLEPYLQDEINSKNIKPLLALLKLRSRITCNTAESYPYASEQQINALYITLAKDIAAKLGKHAYKILMPDLHSTHDPITDEAQENQPLNNYILNDEGTALLDIAATLEFAEQDGRLKKYDKKTRTVALLTDSEKNRLIHSSPQALLYFNSIEAVSELQQTNGSVGSLLRYLIKRFTNYGGLYGDEYTSGQAANTSIANFSNFLSLFTDAERIALFQTNVYPIGEETFGDLWRKISDPNKKKDVDGNLDVSYCVGIIGSKIETLLQTNTELDHTFLQNLSGNKNNHINQFILEREFAKQQFTQKTPASSQNIPQLRKFSQNMLNNLLTDEAIAEDNELFAKIKIQIPDPFSTLTIDTLRLSLAKYPKPSRVNALKIMGINNVRRVVDSDSTFDLVLLLIPKNQRLKLLLLLGKDHVTQIIKNGYGLLSLLAELPPIDHLPLLELLDDNLERIFKDMFQLAHIISALSNAVCDKMISLIATQHICSIIPSGNDLGIFLEDCLTADHWHKLSAILISKDMQNVVANFLAKHFTKMPANSQVSFITTIGVTYAASLLKTPEHLQHLLSILPIVQQKQLVIETEPAHLRNLLLSEKHRPKKKSELKAAIKKAITKIDLFNNYPEMRKHLLRETVSFYATERAKTSSLGMFADKTKAVMALDEFMQKGIDQEVAKVHCKQLLRENEVGELYRRMRHC
jgi:hypothetical protein